MKTSKLFAAAAIMLAAVACQVIDEGQAVKSQLKVTATIAEDEASKVDYTIDNDNNIISPTWHNGDTPDKIIGFDNNGNTFTFTVNEVTDEGKNAKFDLGGYGPVAGVTKLYAIYAPGVEASSIDNKTLEIDLSAQGGVLDGEAPVLMCATASISNDQVNFVFENKTAIIGVKKFQLNGSTMSHTVTSMTLNGVITTGTFELDGDDNLVLRPASTTSSITAEGSWPTDASGVCTTAVYFAAMPTSSNVNLSLDAITEGEKNYINVTAINPTTLNAGQYYYMSKKLGEPEASVTIGGVTTKYMTIGEAWSVANSSNEAVTVTLLKDCSRTSLLGLSNAGSGAVVLNLNGKTLTSSGRGIQVLERNLTITDNSPDDPNQHGAVVSTAKNNYPLYISTDANVTLAKGTIRNSSSYRAINVANNGNFTMNGGTVSADAYGIALSGSGNISVTGGSISGSRAISSITLTSDATFTGALSISGGTLEGKSSYGIYITKGEINVSDGTIESNSYCIYSAGASTNVSGGYFSASDKSVELFVTSGSGKCYVTRGVFDRPVNNLATHDESDKKYYNSLNTDEGTKNAYPYCVVSSESAGVSLIATSSISTFEFDHASFESAIKHGTISNNAITIAMNDNETCYSSIDLTNQNGKTITFDINGKTVTSHASPAFTTSTSLTIKDSQSQNSKGILQSDQIQILYVSSGLPDIVLDGCVIYCTANPSDAGYVIQINSEDSKSTSRPSFTAQNNAIVVSTGSSVRAIGSTNSSVGANYTLGDCYITSKHRAIFGSTGTVITINDGASIYSENEEPVYLGSTKSGSKMTINSGYFYGGKGVNCSSGANVTINGGYFNRQVGTNVSTKLQELENAVNNDHYTTPASCTNYSYGFSKSN